MLYIYGNISQYHIYEYTMLHFLLGREYSNNCHPDHSHTVGMSMLNSGE